MMYTHEIRETEAAENEADLIGSGRGAVDDGRPGSGATLVDAEGPLAASGSILDL